MGIVGANLEYLGSGNENAFRCVIGENSAIIYLLDNYIGVWKVVCAIGAHMKNAYCCISALSCSM